MYLSYIHTVYLVGCPITRNANMFNESNHNIWSHWVKLVESYIQERSQWQTSMSYV